MQEWGSGVKSLFRIRLRPAAFEPGSSCSADILFHEAYSFDPENNPYDAEAPVSLDHMQAFHTSTAELADILKKVKPKGTVLYHYTVFTPPNATDQERGVNEIRESG